jgi:chromosomal replication initiation ATPase DnaA
MNLQNNENHMQKSLKQYTLPLIQRPNFTSYSYFVSESNAPAYKLVEQWPNWPAKRYVVYGPTGYGKTHLGHILRDLTDGVFLQAALISQKTFENIQPKTCYIVDDIHEIQEPSQLFHFYNLIVENECAGVYLSNAAPGQYDMGLPDLNSRFRSLALIELPQPDEALCKAIIKKVFSDLQITVGEEVIDYMLGHMSRSLTDIHRSIQLMNQTSLEQKRKITIPFIKELFDIK